MRALSAWPLGASALAALLLPLAIIALASTIIAPTHAALLGIDFGSEFIKVASVKPGTPFHIVVDEQSKRKVPAVVAFDNGERHFGNGAVQLALRKPKDTYLWAHTLLGKDINSPQVAMLRNNGFPWEIVELPGRRSLGFRHSVAKNEGDADVVFSVEEIVAMSLQHVIKIAEADAESPAKDCVITVPPYWTHRERQAMMDAAEIAGLNVLSLINENTAAAVQYGIDRKYSANETHTIMLYNMGSTSTKVNVAQFTGYVRKERGSKTNKTVGQFEMLSLGYDDSLGGHAFEQRLTDFIVKEVNKQATAQLKKEFDIRNNPKGLAKIRAAAEKAKVVLSANQESLVFLNSLYEDTDVKMMITREQFYTMCEDLLARVTAPIERAVSDAGLTLEQIDAVVIIGGAVRIPAVQAAIKTYVQKEFLTQNLNGDEAMVMGAVFRAANLSTTFKVRPFGMIDTTPFPVGVRISNEGVATTPATGEEGATPPEGGAEAAAESQAAAFSKRAALFKRYNRLLKKKTVQFSHNTDFTAQLSHDNSVADQLPAGIPLPLDEYSVTGVQRLMSHAKYTDLLKTQKPRLGLTFLLDSSGLSSLVRAEATLEEMIQVPKPKPANATANATTTDAAAKKDGEGSTEKQDGEAAGADAAASEKPADDAASNGETKDAAAEPEIEYITKKKTHTIPLLVSKTGAPGSIECMNATHKILAKATLEKLRRADDLKKEIAAAKNTLEAHIYATRAALNEPEVEPVSSEEQRETARSALAAAEDWLYEQGDDSAVVFTDKLKELRALSDPILFRVAEQTALPTALNTSSTLLEFVRKQVVDYEKSRPWVSEAQRNSLTNLADEVEEWLTEKRTAQAAVAAHEPPVLESEAVYERLRPLHKLSTDISKIKKPVEKPKPKPKTDKKAKKNATATEDEDAEKSAKDDATAAAAENNGEEAKAGAEGASAGEKAGEGNSGASGDAAAESTDGETQQEQPHDHHHPEHDL